MKVFDTLLFCFALPSHRTLQCQSVVQFILKPDDLSALKESTRRKSASTDDTPYPENVWILSVTWYVSIHPLLTSANFSKDALMLYHINCSFKKKSEWKTFTLDSPSSSGIFWGPLNLQLKSHNDKVPLAFSLLNGCDKLGL